MRTRDRIVSWATLICFVVGAAAGLLWPDLSQRISFVGSVYVTILKYLALPALILSVFHAALRGGRNAAGILIRALITFVVMFAASFLLCAMLYSVFAPGKGFALLGETVWQGEKVSLTPGSVLRNVLSLGGVTSVNGLYFPAILFALLGGFLCSIFRSDALEKGTAAVEGFFLKLLSYVMMLTPLGVFSLMAKFTASFGLDALKSSGAYIAWAYGGCLLVLFAVMLLPLWALDRIGPGQYFRRTGRLFLTALSTCSSAATLPETMRTCREAFGASERTVGIVAPLGCTIHMCGGAVSFSLLGLFVLQMTGRPVTLGALFTMLLFALLLNMGAPGIPGGGIVLGATYLGMLGVEHAELFLGMYAGIYRLLDMAYTALNVAGDVTATVWIDRWEKKR
ncbi:MAG: dicarboxylate/amino acid:cation symporter [Clostridia bacterium]|nr:dicarboxylate/amino acid:cation symporter [Clostridia bacterium]